MKQALCNESNICRYRCERLKSSYSVAEVAMRDLSSRCPHFLRHECVAYHYMTTPTCRAIGKKKVICSLPLGFDMTFSISLIIHAALTQPEHLILVRWMGLETQ